MTEDLTHPKRVALIVGIGTFDVPKGRGREAGSAPWEALPFVGARVEGLKTVLASFGYKCLIPQRSQLTSSALAPLIADAAREAGPDGILIVHVLSHGFVSQGTQSLFAIGSDGTYDPDRDVESWIKPIVLNDELPPTLFLLDLCQAGTAARFAWQTSIADGSSRAWVVAACGPSQEAYNGRFTEAVTRVLDAFADSEIMFDPALRHIPLHTIAQETGREVKRLAEAKGAIAQVVTGSLIDMAVDPPDVPFFPLRYTDDARTQVRRLLDVAVAPFLDEALDHEHFIKSAAGMGDMPGRDAPGCFSGREQQLAILSDWFNRRDGVPFRMVTGSPGVGKSALLGILVCATHPLLRIPTESVWRHVKGLPHSSQDLAAIHARQRSLDQIVTSLGKQLELDVPDQGWTSQALIDRLMARPRPATIVVDAIDEADSPRQVVSELLLPLARRHRADGQPACRLLVAARPWDEFDDLRRLADNGRGLMDLDTVASAVLRTDLDKYVDGLLRHHKPYHEVEFAGARGTFASAVAHTLTAAPAAHAMRSGEFLVAGLYARHVVTTQAPVRDFETARALGEGVPLTLPELLELDLTDHAEVVWLRPVLAALAYARGDGMPAQTIPHAATAFAPASRPGADPPDWQAVERALGAARFYLRRTTDKDGTALFRLFHKGLADYLQQRPAGATGTEAGTVPSHQRLFAALVAPLESPDGSPRWDIAEPYLLRHAVQHAIDAGQANRLGDDPEFMVHADPTSLAALLERHPCDWLTATELLSICSVPAAATSRGRRQLLALMAARKGATQIVDRLVGSPNESPPLRWFPVWTINHRATSGTEATDAEVTDAEVTAVACDDIVNVVAIGTASGSIRVHHMSGGSGVVHCDGHSTDVTCLRFAVIDSRLLLISGAANGEISVWDADTGARTSHVTAVGAGPVRSLTVTKIGLRMPVRSRVNADARFTDILVDVHAAAGDTVKARTGTAIEVTYDGDLVDRMGQLHVRDATDHRRLDTVALPSPAAAVATTGNGSIALACGTETIVLRPRPPLTAAQPAVPAAQTEEVLATEPDASPASLAEPVGQRPRRIGLAPLLTSAALGLIGGATVSIGTGSSSLTGLTAAGVIFVAVLLVFLVLPPTPSPMPPRRVPSDPRRPKEAPRDPE